MYCNSLQLNPSSSNDWVLNSSKTKTAQTIPDSNRFEPISSFSLGSNFNTEVLVIEVDVSNAKPHWSAAGFVYQQFNYPGLSVSNLTYFLKLNTPNLLQIQNEQNYPYEVIYYPRKYFQSVTVKTWRYIGQINYLTIDDRLRALEQKIDQLL